MSTEADLLAVDPAGEDESDLETSVTEAVLQSSDWTTETILAQLRKGNIELSPAFQRREAWTDERKSTFIESLILRMPVPQLVLAERKDARGKFIVIDGKQRLIALLRFGSEQGGAIPPLELSALRVRADLNGHTLESLRMEDEFSADVTAFENETIRTVVLRNWREESFLWRVFLRLNTGSLPLSPQELRQALNPGLFTTYADERSSRSPGLRRILNNDRPDFRMRDVELFVRFFAFSMLLPSYNGNLKTFLDNTCQQLNETLTKEGTTQVDKVADSLESAIETTYDIFGENAFRRRVRDGFENRFNRALYDVMLYYFRDPGVANASKAARADVFQAFVTLSEDSVDFQNSVQATTKSVGATYTRLRLWGERLGGVVGQVVRPPELLDGRMRV